MPEELPLDPDLIDVLSSETRRDILSHLQGRRMTVTELSQQLDLRKATIHEHMKKLVRSGLVERQEDERVWVYYRLTPRGKKLLNPQRTRFYLAIAITALSTLLIVSAAAFYLASGPVSLPAPDAGTETEEEDAFHIAADDEPQEYTLYITDHVHLQTDAHPETQAFLVASEHKEAIRQGDTNVQGTPLHPEPQTPRTLDKPTTTDIEESPETEAITSETPRTHFTTQTPIPPGTYHLFLRGEHEDNRHQMPLIHIHKATVTASHDTWWKGLSEDIHLTIETTDQPLEGHVSIEPIGQPAPTLQTKLDDGHARLQADRLDTLPTQTYRIILNPHDTHQPLNAGTLHLQEPTITTAPQIIPTGTPTSLTVTANADGDPINAPLQAHGEPLPEPVTGTTNKDTTLQPTHPGPITLDVGRQATYTLQAQTALQGTITVEDGPEHVLQLAYVNGTKAADIAIRLNGNGVGFTNDEGTISLNELPQGTSTLSLEAPPDIQTQAKLHVNGNNVEIIPANITIEGLEQIDPGSFTFLLRETSGSPTKGTLTIETDDQPLITQRYDLDSYEETEEHLTMPTTAKEQNITIHAHPFQDLQLSFEDDEKTPSEANGPLGASLTHTITPPMEPRLETEPTPDTPETTMQPEKQPIFKESDTKQTPGIGLTIIVSLILISAILARSR